MGLFALGLFDLGRQISREEIVGDRLIEFPPIIITTVFLSGTTGLGVPCRTEPAPNGREPAAATLENKLALRA